MVQVYFATNRTADPADPAGFTPQIAAFDRNAMIYGVADVSVDTAAATGTVNAVSDLAMGQFSQQAAAGIVGGNRNLFVFVHGFDNTFEAALVRAALNAEFYRASGDPAADTEVMAFSWPSLGEVVTLGQSLNAAYATDQRNAGLSGFHLRFFLAEADRIRRICQAGDPARRMFLLAHSMGNWALQSGITQWVQGHEPDARIFDEAILAAADEQADSFTQVDGLRLGHLRALARRISIYFSRNDLILGLSTAINLNRRLGFDGPDGRADATLFPPNLFRLVDCTDVSDFGSAFDPLDTHQYYRLSPTVRDDIAAVMARSATPAGGTTHL